MVSAPPPQTWDRIAGSNKRLAPRLAANAARLDRLSERVAERVNGTLRSAALEAVALINGAKDIPVEELARNAAILEQIKGLVNGALQDIMPDMDQAIGRAVRYGGEFVADVVKEQQPGFGMSWDRIPTGLVTELQDRAGQFVTDLSDDTMLNVRKYLAEGAAKGWGTEKIAKALVTETDLGSGAFANPLARARTIARTEMGFAADRGGYAFTRDLAESLPGLMEKFFYYHTGVCDGSCPAAAKGGVGRDGVYPVGVGPRPPLDTHPNCNCARVAWHPAWGL